MAVVRRTILLFLGLMLRASGEQRSIKLVRGASAVDLSPGGSACVASAAPVADAMSGPASLSFLASRRVATAAGDYAAVLFENVTQHLPDGETHLLGVFRGWSGDGRAMLFGDGEPCPGDRPRNATVVATCDGGPRLALARAAQESEIPNFKGSDLGHFPLVSADFWTSDHLLERSRSVDAFPGTRAHGTLTLKRRRITLVLPRRSRTRRSRRCAPTR